MDSPHKMMISARESPGKIPGVGDIRTSWIDVKGMREIQRCMANEEAQSQSKAKKTELKVLATECMKAFESAGLRNSNDPQIKIAVDLCSSYMPQATRQINAPRSTSMANLWKGDTTSASVLPCLTDKKSLGISVLGEKLVETLTEEKRQPPDVSLIM